ncbi:hypothetical protein RN001_000791 [Aquatica leii]|uniref:CN hydrolase domain-containing protein n=1 Tax=Aquatica leii TaxID=1421715 RepID=A0AAN7SSI4_9COLE|nr:hypothetical protein RN001_000791 [Aquatica leii]
MKKADVLLVITIIFSVTGLCFNLKTSYTAAVVDYNHIYADYPKELLKENVEQYIKHMRNASREYADIIVFPEYGLIDIYTMYNVANKNISNLEDYSSLVPNPKSKIVPCEDRKMETYAMQLVNISCAARIHGIYTVFNLLEKAENEKTGELEFFNTNVILDRLGTVIAKYRKIHLSEEPFLQPGTEIVTFKTDFNVTFSIFTCFDLLFHFPAIEILEIPEVTDIIFPTAWYSETPFLQALSMQHGYAKSSGVNFLAAGLQEPFNSDGGSAIYLNDGKIAEAFITNVKQSKIVIQDVPIIKRRTETSCARSNKIISKEPDTKKHEQTEIDDFPIPKDRTIGYLYEPLSKGPKTLTRICTENESFCCIFNITVDKSSPPDPDYTHRLTIYEGLSPFGSKVLGGIRVCALVACLNESETSCGYRTNTTQTSTKFKSIEIQTIVDITNNSHNQPSTLKSDLTPITDYVYCVTNVSDSKIKITMALSSPQDSIVTFGIYGRIYSMDTTEQEPIPTVPPTKDELNTGIIIAIVCVSTLILVATAFVLYKFCTKFD